MEKLLRRGKTHAHLRLVMLFLDAELCLDWRA
jgi:hypothetical protein